MVAVKTIKASKLVTIWGVNSREQPPPETLVGLADSIRAVGLVHPVGVRYTGDVAEVVYGFRRVEACRLIDPDYLVATLDAGELAGWDAQLLASDRAPDAEALARALANLAENAGGRSDLSSWEVARQLVQIRELAKLATGKRPSGRELAKLAGVSEAQVSRLIKVWAWCCEPGNEAMRDAWHNGTPFDQMLRACEAAQAKDAGDGPKRGRPKGSGKKAAGASGDGGDDDDDDDDDEAKEAVRWAKRWGDGIRFVQERLETIGKGAAQESFAAGAQWALGSISVKPRELPAAVVRKGKVAK